MIWNGNTVTLTDEERKGIAVALKWWAQDNLEMAKRAVSAESARQRHCTYEFLSAMAKEFQP